jgi:peptide chain release factor 1
MNATELKTRLQEVEARFREIEESLGNPDVVSNAQELRKQSKLHNEMGKVVTKFRQLQTVESRIAQAEELAEDDDPEIAQMAHAELEELTGTRVDLEREIQLLLLPTDPLDERNIIVEIRAGTGGEEAALFASNLFRLYGKYAEKQGWRVEMLSSNETGLSGFKEVIFSVEGERVYSRMKFEAGTHRVQRVPETEAQGRIHTSAVTVAVLPEAEDVDITIKPEELRIDVFRSGGPGGQSVNTTDSAVRITHVPTGTTVQCQDEKSQHKNKAKAMKVLRARLMEAEHHRKQADVAATRRKMVGSGDRSERIRTYNYPQNRLTDHRINLTLYSLDRIMEGDLDPVIDSLVLSEQTEKLKTASH